MINSLLNIDELSSAVKGKCYYSKNLIKNPLSEICFTNVVTDSRNVCEKSLFVPLIGEFQNGHKYVPQSVEKGASVIFIQKDEYAQNSAVYSELLEKFPVCFITVENTLHALQDAAEAYVAKFPNLTKISVTGSCGKTTTKEMIVSVFKAKYADQVVYTQGNLNSETGLPLSVFNIRENHTIGIFEMGMNRVDEIGEISKVLKSHYGIITNIGTAHIGILGSRENIACEKRKSFRYIPENGAVFVPSDDDFADYCVENVKGKIFKYGKNVPESESGVAYKCNNGLKGMCFTVDGVDVNLPLSGEHNFVNALGVIACAKACGIETKYIKSGLENMDKLSGRMEIAEVVLKNEKKVSLVKDCYNANPDSMSKVIEFVSSVDSVNKRIFVLADMLELGEKSEASHKGIGKTLLENKFDLVILVGKEMRFAKAVLEEAGKKNVEYFADNSEKSFAEIAKILLDSSDNNDVIVFKGSNSMALGKIIPEVTKDE